MVFANVAWRYKDPLTAAKLEQMAENLRVHDHRNDGSQGAPLGAWATGKYTEQRSAAGVYSQAVAFPAGRFSTPPDVIVWIEYLSAASPIESVIVTQAPSINGFTVQSYRSNATNTTIHWIATERR